MLGQWPTVSRGRGTEICLYAVALVFCLEALVMAAATNDVSPLNSAKSYDENPELENEYSKRAWKTDLPMWGKRGWSNLHSGWGKRQDLPSEDELSYLPPPFDKRAWQKLQGGWGKRYIPTEDEMTIRQLAANLDDTNDEETDVDIYTDRNFDSHDLDKRNWNKFTDGWGKRSGKWEKFRGSWGKREPAWNNLKGLWGKRSVSD